jgi:tetratricopeptide (TPR) repeat protein
MTMESESEKKYSFAVRTVPWLVAAAALVVYLLTLNPWVSLANLPQVSRTAGWTWQPELLSPAYMVATYPLCWLPAQWIPLGLNLFSALCAVLTLAQLARSVALLPHDRSHEEREREKSEHSLLTIRSAWVPPMLAALVCGLQLTFWEHATNGTIETFDLLFFAWVVRALLEYRLDGRESWLFRAALVYGLGMTNNFAMWGFFPVFIGALVWVRGLSFFNPRFLGRMALCGLIGLSLYLLPPLLASLSNTEPVNFWQALKVNLALQKNIIFFYPKLPSRGLENLDWVVLVVVCVLPVFLFSLRWPSYFGDTSQLGIQLATIIFHLMCGLYLCICVWCLFDAPFSPRHRGYSIPFLTFYYLAALSIGYFSGYFLLVFTNLPVRGRRPVRPVRIVKRIVLALVVALAVVAPVGLVLKNLPNISTTNGPMVREYADALAAGLPRSGVLLSDDPRRLFFMQAWLARAGREKDFLPLDTHTDAQNLGPLAWPAYHRYLSRKYPGRWEAMPDPKREQLFNAKELIELASKLAEKSELYYLHPSFGYYFEFFYPEPHGLTYHLKRFGTGSLLPPPFGPELIAENEKLWTKVADQYLERVLPVTMPREPGAKLSLAERCFKAAHLRPERNAQALNIGALYSRALNEWAVTVQKSGDLEKAATYFDLAQKLNADNVVAEINQKYNQNLRAGQSAPIQLPKSVEDRFGKYRTWDRVLGENGPYDEPGFCFAQGYTFVRGGYYRQAAQAFDRVRVLSPADAASRMWLAQLNLLARLPDKTLELTQEVRNHPERFTLSSTNRNELLVLEAGARYARNEPGKAVQILEAALEQSPRDEHLLAATAGVYFQNGQYSNALATFNRHLKLAPDNPTLLVKKSLCCMQINAFDEAIPSLTRALALETNNHTAQSYRAISYLRTDRLEAAQKDYETLQRAFPKAFQVYYGLGEIAYRRKETNAAIGYYEAYLTNAVPTTDESKFVGNRLKELKGEKP